VVVTAAETPAGVTIEVRNDGRLRGPASKCMGAGVGLTLLRARCLEHGGTIDSGALPEDGWRVALALVPECVA
jgi:signal transduction histidine kinase